MHAIRLQFTICFGVMGSLIPYFSEFLSERGLGKDQIGQVFAVGAAAMMITPMLLTLLADTHVQGRRLIAGLFLGAAASLGTMLLVEGFHAHQLCWGLYCLCVFPIVPLQDALFFAEELRLRIIFGGKSCGEIPVVDMIFLINRTESSLS